MKLNAKYLPTQTAIETNPVYLHIQSLVVGMTSDFPISRPCLAMFSASSNSEPIFFGTTSSRVGKIKSHTASAR